MASRKRRLHRIQGAVNPKDITEIESENEDEIDFVQRGHKRKGWKNKKRRKRQRILKLRTDVLSEGRGPFRTALRILQNGTRDVYGPLLDQCVRIPSKDFKKVRVVISADAEPKLYRPYKIAWLAHYGRWPNDITGREKRECSHLCGAKECFNVEHLIEETNATNQSRRICHNELKRMAKERKLNEYVKVTYALFEKGHCPHHTHTDDENHNNRETTPSTECFIMLRPGWVNETDSDESSEWTPSD